MEIVSFDTLKTRIDGLDGILGGGIRYPDDSAVFLCLAGGPGTGKTLLALELVVRAWLEGEDGANFLYYSVEHTPEMVTIPFTPLKDAAMSGQPSRSKSAAAIEAGVRPARTRATGASNPSSV